MNCPHCNIVIDKIIGAPEGVDSFLAFCSECKEVVKCEDNKLQKLSILEIIRFNASTNARIRSAQLN